MNENIEIIIIDNNSIDGTRSIASEYKKSNSNIRYILEPKNGLSFARNRGIKEAKSDWILYIDDDGVAFPDLLARALYLVERGDFDCVGGMYFGYTNGEKPNWLPKNFGTKDKYSDTLSICPYSVPSGGIVLYKKKKIEDLNGFDCNFGMYGDRKKTGEETEIQFRLQKSGGKIGFDPELKIYHLIKEDYMTLKWGFLSRYLEGYYFKYAENEDVMINFFIFIKSILGALFLRTPNNFFKILFKKNYYFQNFLLDTWSPVAYYFGKVFS